MGKYFCLLPNDNFGNLVTRKIYSVGKNRVNFILAP
jgi:hypothetical protein